MVMNKEKNNLISASELKKKLNNKKIKILDARWFLEDSQKGKKLYDKLHIPQAIFFDINNLSDKTSDLPHMLPKKEIFKKYLDENGISKENEIIVYDQIGFFSSARVWFIFKYFSFDKVKILNEGFLMWEKKNYPTDNKIHKKETTNNKLTENKDLLANKALIEKNIKSKNILCVAPDVGGTERARALGKLLNVGLAIVDKRRPKPGQSQVMNIIGNVKDKTCIIVDDIIDSGGTIVNAAKALKNRGAKEVYVYITHGVLSGSAVEKIKKSVIKNLVITDTIENHEKIKSAKNIEVLPISSLMGEAIKRISNSTSVSDLFK